ncbi:hypothetical protein HK104_003143 [Borealophlyctis nickersoniae]|nr:hypothetical protein HK104_003143 [Borealophlyctis nickersoniae]
MNGGAAGEHYNYLQNYKWWAGMITMVLGEAANFAAYSYAPAILVTPLGAGSVLIGAVLASIFLKEELGVEGKIGCALCILGSIIIILHSPEDPHVESVDQILEYALQPGTASLFLIYRVGPVHGKKNMLVYIAICSLVGSVSVMACKGFGIALKLTFAGHNQLVYPSTYVFGITVVSCAVTQMNYFNKALDLFSTNRVTPIYYVFFTTATIVASVILFKGFNDTDSRDIISMFCGFLTIFIGVFQLTYHKSSSSSSGSSSSSNGGILDKGITTSRRSSLSRQRAMAGGGTESLALKTYDEESAPLRETLEDGEDSD